MASTSNACAGLVIAIDGPAGAGKSSVARLLARQLQFEFLDTGALYRCVTLAVLQAQLDPRDEAAVVALTDQLQIELSDEAVRLNGQDVSQAIRALEVASAIGAIADNIEVRKRLTHWQRRWTSGRRVVTEGRDQGSEVFYDSPCKIFLVASSEERALRRLRELQQRGVTADYQCVLDQQNQRDQEDRQREVGGLRRAADAIEFCTTGLTLDAVVTQLLQVITERVGASRLRECQVSHAAR